MRTQKKELFPTEKKSGRLKKGEQKGGWIIRKGGHY